MNQQIEQKKSKKIESTNPKETKLTVRFRTKEAIKAIHYIMQYCEELGLALNAFLSSIVIEKADQMLKQTIIPSISDTLFGAARRAIYAGTKGQNIFTLKELKPIVEQSEITDMKLNLLIALLTGQADKTKFQDFQNPPEVLLVEPKKFEDYRKIINKRITSKLADLEEKSKNEQKNAEKFSEIISIPENIYADQLKPGAKYEKKQK